MPTPDHANNRRTVEDYERCARDYVAQVDSTPLPATAAALRHLAAAIAPGKRVLEIGSGPGWDADYLETLGLDVHRTDVTAAFRAFQAERGKHCDPLDVLTDEISNTYDGIAMLYVLQHFEREELPAVLRKLARALRAGGALLLSYAEGAEDHWEDAESGKYRVVHWTREAFDLQLAQAGLAVEWELVFQGKDWPWRIVAAQHIA